MRLKATADRGESSGEYDYDFFISHASEDKKAFVRPLAQALVDAGFRVWYDEFTLEVGDSIGERIDQGLKRSHFGVVVLSPSYFAKRWPRRELEGLFALETGHDRFILPIWHNVTAEDVRRESPTLSGIYALQSSWPLDEIVDRLGRKVDDQNLYKKEFGELVLSPHFDRRILQNPDLKIAAGHFFSDTFLTSLLKNGYTQIFFESGSTVSYVANAIFKHLREPWVSRLGIEWLVKTNSMFIVYDMVGQKMVPNMCIQLLPGFVDEQYGATFPREAEIAGYLNEEAKGICLMTASGAIFNSVQFAGPIVGSRQLLALKRGILRSGWPAILFLDETKFRPFPEIGRDYMVFETRKDWERACERIPLALCLAARSERVRSHLIVEAQEFGFQVYGLLGEYSKCYVVLMKNKRFPDVLLT